MEQTEGILNRMIADLLKYIRKDYTWVHDWKKSKEGFVFHLNKKDAEEFNSCFKPPHPRKTFMNCPVEYDMD